MLLDGLAGEESGSLVGMGGEAGIQFGEAAAAEEEEGGAREEGEGVVDLVTDGEVRKDF